MNSKLDHIMRVLPAWGNLRDLRQLEGGYRNTVLLVERGDEQLVAKSTRRSAEAVAWVHDLYDVAETVGIKVPRLMPSSRGQFVERGVTVERWVDGVPLAEVDYGAAIQAIERFHTATREWPQRPGFASSQELLHLARGGDVDLEQMPPDLVRACREAWRMLSEQPQSAVHGDMNPSNMLMTEDGRIAFVDWDEARYDVSALDLTGLSAERRVGLGGDAAKLRRASEAWEVAVCWQVEPEHARAIARRLER